MGTFAVDEVAAVTDRLPTTPLAARFPDAWCVGGDSSLPIVDHGPGHALLGAVRLAFDQHRPLVLSPDAVWLTIAQGVAQHVRRHAEALRPRLVRHQGKEALRIDAGGELPVDAAGWGALIAALTDRLTEHLGGGAARLFVCDFSTSTAVDRLASQIVLLDAYSPYFDYYVAGVCGIPSITLTGTVEDWRRLRARLDVVAELELGWWTRALVPIADQLVRAAEGAPDRDFWRRIYKPRDAYVEDLVTGWIAHLYPYLSGPHMIEHRNPMLEPKRSPRRADGIRCSAVADTRSNVEVILERGPGQRVGAVALEAGLVAVTQDPEGRLQPISGWAVRASRPHIAAVIDRIRAHGLTTAPDPADELRPHRTQGPAEVVALLRAFTSATFAGGWRLLPVAEQERITIDCGGRRVLWGHRYLDLPDGSALAWALGPRGWLHLHGRLDDLALDADEAAHAIAILPRRHRRSTGEGLRVLEGSLAALLTRALDGGGLDVPTSGTLLAHLADDNDTDANADA